MFDDLRVVDRYEIGLFFEILHRITAGDHNPGNKRVRLAQSRAGGIHESGLHLAPFLLVAVPLGGAEGLDGQALPLAKAVLEIGLGPFFTTGAAHGAGVLGTELVP